MQTLYIGAGIFLFLTFYSRVISNKATVKLSDEEKIKLIDAFSKNRVLNVIVLIAIISVFVLISQYSSISPYMAFILYAFVFCLWISIQLIQSRMRLVQLGFNSLYIRSFTWSSTLRLIGIVALFISVYLQFLA